MHLCNAYSAMQCQRFSQTEASRKFVTSFVHKNYIETASVAMPSSASCHVGLHQLLLGGDQKQNQATCIAAHCINIYAIFVTAQQRSLSWAEYNCLLVMSFDNQIPKDSLRQLSPRRCWLRPTTTLEKFFRTCCTSNWHPPLLDEHHAVCVHDHWAILCFYQPQLAVIRSEVV